MLSAEPSFIDRDPAAIEAAMVAQYELDTGRKLQPAQPERLLIAMLAYRETLVRQQFQAAAVQSLLAFAKGSIVDYLGELVSVTRLAAVPATTTIQFTATAGHAGIVVPAGTRISTANGAAVFALDAQLVIAAGVTTATAAATCQTAGVIGNGYLAGAIATILDPVASITAAANTTTTAGGAETEGDAAYKARIKQAPSQYSTAGSLASYKFHALSAHAAIVDVAVTSTAGTGVVNIYPLTATGTPSTPVLDAVTAACSADEVRPLTDAVNVVAPAAVDYSISASLILYTTADATATMAAANAAAQAYVDTTKAALGKDVIMSQIVAVLQVEGVYKVTLAAPAADVVISPNAWANCTGIALTLAGTNGG